MKITQEIRQIAANKGVSEEHALHEEMQKKAQEFVEAGAEIYQKA
jgi:phosphomethylpyrimidine synthase